MNQCAFDYDKQQWIEGAAAIQVLLAQRRQELELLSGPDGERFAKFTAVTDRLAADMVPVQVLNIIEPDELRD